LFPKDFIFLSNHYDTTQNDMQKIYIKLFFLKYIIATSYFCAKMIELYIADKD